MPLRNGTCIAFWFVATLGIAQADEAPKLDLFRQVQLQPNDLARYTYLTKITPHLTPADHLLATQLRAAAEAELGLYNEAILHFPLVSRVPSGLALPQASAWHAVDATDVIAQAAAKHRIVLVNEAHHDAHTRELTLALLPRLRALGFNYFAAEALGENDTALTQRGYPVTATGSEYLHEPLYGEIIRTAIRLGFTIVPYDSSARTTAGRETEQAHNLYQRVFAKDPNARLFVHAGYAHIDKAKGRLGNIEPMAMQLQGLTGLEPLSIDQTEFRDVLLENNQDIYHQILAAFDPQMPTVLLDHASGKTWSTDAKKFDISVILPPALEQQTAKGAPTAWMSFGLEGIPVKRSTDVMPRPSWLSLGGQRKTFPIDATLCARTLPCVVEAHYVNEPNDASAADRYTFVKADTTESLYLFPGRYRLRAWSIDGKTLSEKTIELRETDTPTMAEPTA